VPRKDEKEYTEVDLRVVVDHVFTTLYDDLGIQFTDLVEKRCADRAVAAVKRGVPAYKAR